VLNFAIFKTQSIYHNTETLSVSKYQGKYKI